MIWLVDFPDRFNYLDSFYWLWDNASDGTLLTREFCDVIAFMEAVEEYKIAWGYIPTLKKGCRFIFCFTDQNLAMRFKLMDFSHDNNKT